MANINLSFNSIVENIKSDKFIALSKNLADNKIISKDEHLSNLDIAKASSKIADNASARFLTISESKVGELFNERGVDIYKALKEKAIIIFVLNPLLYPETAQAMGRLILIDTKKAVSKLFNSENRKFFIFDEINVYASSVLVDLINKRNYMIEHPGSNPFIDSTAWKKYLGNKKKELMLLEEKERN